MLYDYEQKLRIEEGKCLKKQTFGHFKSRLIFIAFGLMMLKYKNKLSSFYCFTIQSITSSKIKSKDTLIQSKVNFCAII